MFLTLWSSKHSSFYYKSFSELHIQFVCRIFSDLREIAKKIFAVRKGILGIENNALVIYYKNLLQFKNIWKSKKFEWNRAKYILSIQEIIFSKRLHYFWLGSPGYLIGLNNIHQYIFWWGFSLGLWIWD